MEWLQALAGGLSGQALWLPLIWAGLIALAIAIYIILDGFDLGIGILFPIATHDEWRDTMMVSVAPVWDGNETWLVLGGAGLFAVFPLAYALVLPALYIPLIIMVLALIFRGVAFEFRFKAERSRYLWDASFHYGSLVATFAQGIVLGAFVQGFSVEGREFTGGRFDWLTPFALFTGLSLVAGYSLLGATWLVVKTTGELEAWARKRAKMSLLLTLAAMVVISLWVPFLEIDYAQRWLSWPNIALLSPMPILSALAGYGLWRALHNPNTTYLPFIYAVALFMLCYLGLAISLFPYLVAPEVTFWEAAATPSAQWFTLVGFAIMLPVVLGYTAYTYWVFRGKVSPEMQRGYH